MMDMLKFDILASSRAGPAFDGLRTDLTKTKGMLAEVTVAANRTSKSMGGIGGALSGHGTRNIALQLSQVGQQTMATGDFMRALAIQLPDMALGFGTLGIAAGVAAGALLPLIGNMAGAGDGAENLDEALGDLSSALGDYKSSLDLAKGSTADLVSEFGAASPALRQALTDLAALGKIEVHKQIDEAAESLDNLATGTSWWDDRSAQSAAQDFLGLKSINKSARAAGAQFAHNLDLLRSTADTGQRLQLAIDIRQQLMDATGGFQNMTGEQETFAKGLAFVIRDLSTFEVVVDDADDGINRMVGSMSDLVAATDKAVDAAMGLLSNSEIGVVRARLQLELRDDPVELAGQLAAVSFDAGVDQSLPLDNDQQEAIQAARRERIQNAREEAELVQLLRSTREKERAALQPPGGGGRGVDQHQREAARIIESTRTAAERYADELGDLNELRDMGYLSELQHARAVDELQDALRDAESGASQFGSAFKSAFLDFADGATTAKDAADNLLGSLSNLLLNKAFDSFVAPGLDGLFDALIPGSGEGGGTSPLNSVMAAVSGARAGGGPVDGGKSYVVGERGPEIFTPGVTGSIAPNSAIATAAPAPVVNMPITIHNEASNQVGVDVDRSSDGIRVFIRQQVRGMIGSGEMDQPMSRFGVRPMARGR